MKRGPRPPPGPPPTSPSSSSSSSSSSALTRQLQQASRRSPSSRATSSTSSPSASQRALTHTREQQQAVLASPSNHQPQASHQPSPQPSPRTTQTQQQRLAVELSGEDVERASIKSYMLKLLSLDEFKPARRNGDSPSAAPSRPIAIGGRPVGLPSQGPLIGANAAAAPADGAAAVTAGSVPPAMSMSNMSPSEVISALRENGMLSPSSGMSPTSPRSALSSSPKRKASSPKLPARRQRECARFADMMVEFTQSFHAYAAYQSVLPRVSVDDAVKRVNEHINSMRTWLRGAFPGLPRASVRSLCDVVVEEVLHPRIYTPLFRLFRLANREQDHSFNNQLRVLSGEDVWPYHLGVSSAVRPSEQPAQPVPPSEPEQQPRVPLRRASSDGVLESPKRAATTSPSTRQSPSPSTATPTSRTRQAVTPIDVSQSETSSLATSPRSPLSPLTPTDDYMVQWYSSNEGKLVQVPPPGSVDERIESSRIEEGDEEDDDAPECELPSPMGGHHTRTPVSIGDDPLSSVARADTEPALAAPPPEPVDPRAEFKERYASSIRELKQMSTMEFCTPGRKLGCAVRAFRDIAASARSDKSIGADDLLPLLAYVLLCADANNLASECRYMECFISEAASQKEEGYCLGTLSGIVSWLSGLDPLKELEKPLPPSVLKAVRGDVQRMNGGGRGRGRGRGRGPPHRRFHSANPGDQWRERHVRKFVYKLATSMPNDVAKVHQKTLRRFRRRARRGSRSGRRRKKHKDHRRRRHRSSSQSSDASSGGSALGDGQGQGQGKSKEKLSKLRAELFWSLGI